NFLILYQIPLLNSDIVLQGFADNVMISSSLCCGDNVEEIVIIESRISRSREVGTVHSNLNGRSRYLHQLLTKFDNCATM
ncbi:MAG: hypothetical protein LBB12_04065, partial [Holosporaceae bacterium]|nr:hypothetical protein [Holosporaceae bacterium]